MKKKEKISYFDEKMESIGIPVNPHSVKLGSPYLTKDPKFIVAIFVLAVLVIAIIIYFVSNS